MRQLTSLDAQFLNVESPTTVGHVGSLLVVDPSTYLGGEWGSTPYARSTRRACTSSRCCASGWSRCCSGWAALLGRRPALRHRVPPPRAWRCRRRVPECSASRWPASTRGRWTGPVRCGRPGTDHRPGRRQGGALPLVHHAAIDGVSGEEILETIMDLTVEPRRCPRRRSRSRRAGRPPP